MGARELPLKSLKILLLSLEKQGSKVKETKKGYLIHFPNGDSTCFHKTPSDVRAIHNMRARVRQAGLVWPLDKEELRKIA